MKHNLSVKHKIQFTFRCYIVWNIILGERKCIRGLKKNFAYTGKQGSNKTIAKMIVAQGRVNNTHAQKKKNPQYRSFIFWWWTSLYHFFCKNTTCALRIVLHDKIVIYSCIFNTKLRPYLKALLSWVSCIRSTTTFTTNWKSCARVQKTRASLNYKAMFSLR